MTCTLWEQGGKSWNDTLRSGPLGIKDNSFKNTYQWGKEYKSTETVHLCFFLSFSLVSVILMISYPENHRSGFYHVMRRCRMTEVCWNNNKANVFPVQTDAPLMGCQANFLLSESWRQPNRSSNLDSSLPWALSGYVYLPSYHPLYLIITDRDKKYQGLTWPWGRFALHQLREPKHVRSWSEPASEGAPRETSDSARWCFLFCRPPTQMRELRGDAVCAWLG